MTAVIVEDEIPAGIRLERLLIQNEFQVLVVLNSVKKAIIWLKENKHPDIVFMDIKLRDGNCFEILDKVKIESKIVFTTAFDEYALNAFNYNSIDYLLKPIDESKLNRLLEKIETLKSGFQNEISWTNFNESIFINSYLVASGTHLKKISVQDILYFFSENNATFIFTKENRQFLIPKSLEKIEGEIDYSVVSSTTFDRNNLSFYAIDFPIEFRWRNSTPDNFRFLRIYSGFKYSYIFYDTSILRVNGNVSKLANNPDLVTSQMGVYLAIGYHSINFYTYYGITNLFQSNAAIDGIPLELTTINLGFQFYIL